MQKAISILALFCIVFAAAQQDYRTWLRGKVLYQDNSVVAANILNTNSEQATITDDNGEFAIEVNLEMSSLFRLYNMKSARLLSLRRSYNAIVWWSM